MFKIKKINRFLGKEEKRKKLGEEKNDCELDTLQGLSKWTYKNLGKFKKILVSKNK